MHQEIIALEKNHTWDVVPLPLDKRPIGNKWVYKLKVKNDGSVERCKVRLVAKGFNQIEGVDYVDCFSPVAKAVTIARSSAGTSLTQAKYIQDILQVAGLQHAKAATTPLPQGTKLCATEGVVLLDPEPYRRLVGCLLYLGFTRPDISFGVQQLSQFLHRPCESHWQATVNANFIVSKN
ncbi:UNVERIFIED_CONTAM: Retrovirus-related Pol polyprotein from transposon RE1 [Sesamum latifolium]|uniref:Retrovirus-related Pol polyprotein from transposon RE1 n=1 Tax=Sesamum latifolium TaxID=2727402 RepID=A0AAW2UIZ0_9LAMI